MSNPVLIDTFEDTCILTFNRPGLRSPLSRDVLELLESALAAARARKLIFTGGGGTFASGADLREIAEVDGKTAPAFALRGQKLMRLVDEYPGTAIAAVEGFCFGGALDLALACDMRIASWNAEFCHPGANLGVMTGWGGTQRLPRLVGEAAALEMFLTARRIRADEALQIGLVDSLADDPLAAAMAYRP